MAVNPFVIDRNFAITPSVSGGIAILGNAADGEVGTYFVQLVPQVGFVGSLDVLARPYGKYANDDGVAFVPVPYRRVNVNNLASDYAISTASITQPGIIQIPANGMSIGLMITCSAGQAELYSWPLLGPSSV